MDCSSIITIAVSTFVAILTVTLTAYFNRRSFIANKRETTIVGLFVSGDNIMHASIERIKAHVQHTRMTIDSGILYPNNLDEALKTARMQLDIRVEEYYKQNSIFGEYLCNVLMYYPNDKDVVELVRKIGNDKYWYIDISNDEINIHTDSSFDKTKNELLMHQNLWRGQLSEIEKASDHFSELYINDVRNLLVLLKKYVKINWDIYPIQ